MTVLLISTPLVEDMQAAGKTPTQLARDLETVLARYVKSPEVTVIVSNGRLNCVDPKGELLWRYPYVTDYKCNTASPIAIPSVTMPRATAGHRAGAGAPASSSFRSSTTTPR